MSEKRLQMTVSFGEFDDEVYDYLQAQKNASALIRYLVTKHMREKELEHKMVQKEVVKEEPKEPAKEPEHKEVEPQQSEHPKKDNHSTKKETNTTKRNAGTVKATKTEKAIKPAKADTHKTQGSSKKEEPKVEPKVEPKAEPKSEHKTKATKEKEDKAHQVDNKELLNKVNL